MNTKKIAAMLVAVTVFGSGALWLGNGVYTEKMFEKARHGSEWLQVTVTAHTGCMVTEKNTLESIEKGSGFADIVEFDLHFTKEGVPVLAHDKPKGDEVTFSQAAKLVKSIDGLRVNVDLKSVDNLKEVVKIAKKWDILDRIFFTGVKDEFVEAVKRDAPEVPYYLNVDVKKSKNKDIDYINSLVKKVMDAGAIGINFNYKNASAELVSTFQNYDLLVSVWTVDKKVQMYRMLSYRPDNITTRKPDELKDNIHAVLYVG